MQSTLECARSNLCFCGNSVRRVKAALKVVASFRFCNFANAEKDFENVSRAIVSGKVHWYPDTQ